VELTPEIVECRWAELVRPLRRAHHRRQAMRGTATCGLTAAVLAAAAGGLWGFLHVVTGSLRSW